MTIMIKQALTIFLTLFVFAMPAMAENASNQVLFETVPSQAVPGEQVEVQGYALPWQLNFQPAASPVMETLDGLHDFLLIIITVVSIFVLLVMIYIALKFNRKANPNPATFTHNAKIEVIWTVVPIIILVVIAVPSVRAHYFMEEAPSAEEGTMTIKVTGKQWYWTYEYPDHGGFEFDSYMLQDDEAKVAGEPRLLGVDNRVVVPVDTPVRALITAGDVIHAWAVPALGVKRDAVPGRLNESWFKATKEGIYYGQCSELCGKLHGFMPIAVEVVSQEKFDAWIARQKEAAGIAPTNTDGDADQGQQAKL